MEATIKKIVDGVQSQISTLEEENKALKKSNADLVNRVSDLERQHDADDHYSKRTFVRISGINEHKGELVMGVCNTFETGRKSTDAIE